MLPISKLVSGTAVGTAAFVVFPDYFQNPFNLSYVASIPTGAATYSLQYTNNRATTVLPTWNGSSDVVWNTIVSAGTSTLTGTLTNPLAALRLLVPSATDTATVLLELVQSVNSP